MARPMPLLPPVTNTLRETPVGGVGVAGWGEVVGCGTDSVTLVTVQMQGVRRRSTRDKSPSERLVPSKRLVEGPQNA